MRINPETDLRSVSDAAAFLGVSLSRVAQWIDAGQLRAFTVGTMSGKRPTYILARQDLERFKAARERVKVERAAKREWE